MQIGQVVTLRSQSFQNEGGPIEIAHSHWSEIETHGKSLNQEYPGLLPPPLPTRAVRCVSRK